MGSNLLDEREYDYRLVNPVMSETGYAKRMFTKLSWEVNFIIFSTFILSFIKICKKKYGNNHGKDVNAEKEAWRSICLSSQRHYPVKISKSWNVCKIAGIKCRVRLEGGDAKYAYQYQVPSYHLQ